MFINTAAKTLGSYGIYNALFVIILGLDIVRYFNLRVLIIQV